MESIDGYREDSIAHTPQRVASPANPKPVLLQFTFDSSQLTINGHITRTKRTYGGSGRVYEIRTSHVDLHRRRQLKSRLLSTRHDRVIYVTDAARSSSSGYAMIQLWLPNDYRYDYRYHWAINGGRVPDSGAVITDRVAAPIGKYNNPKCSKVASRYNSRLPLSIITFGTWLDDWIGSLWGERAICANSILFRQTSQQKLIGNERIRMCPIRWHTKRVFMIAVVMIICSRDFQDPRGYWMDRLGTLRRPADSACI